jgi:3-oxoacyl-[acyl-carrier-protein] synthase III
MRTAKIQAVEYYLPEKIVSNEELAKAFSGWTAEKISKKTGIRERHVVSVNECASDLAYQAAVKLFETGVCDPEGIEFILLCTQSPDYFLPTTACILQDKLGIPTTSGALDFNLGCSGYIYGLSLAKGLIESGQTNNVLLITSETYSKYIADDNVGVRTIFGDAAAATLISLDENTDGSAATFGPFVFGTDGSGKENLIVREGASRSPAANLKRLFMNGPEIFSFTIKTVPLAVEKLLAKSKLQINEIDYFIFHQANEYMLAHLRDKSSIPQHKFCIDLESYGNTVSSTVPIALKNALQKGVIKPGDKVVMVGFGVGYSWAACLVQISKQFTD